MPPNLHDALFKRAFTEVENAAGEFRAILPPALVAHLDFGTLRLEPGSFVDEGLQERHADLLYSVNLAGRPAFLYLLLEHQSRADPLMAYRLLLYVTRIWERFVRENPEARRLPAVLPIVLHHGETPWSTATNVHDLVDLEADLHDAVAPHLPSLEFLLDDLGTQSEEALYHRAMSAFGRLVLFCLRSAKAGRLREGSVTLWVDALRQMGEAPGGREALHTIFGYLYRVAGDEQRDFIEAVLAEDVGEAAREVGVTLYDRILQEGREEGREEGRAWATRELLLRLLTRRFGPPSEETLRRVEGASVPELERWAERVLEADVLDDVWS